MCTNGRDDKEERTRSEAEGAGNWYLIGGLFLHAIVGGHRFESRRRHLFFLIQNKIK